MNRRHFFAALVGCAVAPKLAAQSKPRPHLAIEIDTTAHKAHLKKLCKDLSAIIAKAKAA